MDSSWWAAAVAIAVAASWATETNPVHVLPLQRCTVIDVALVALLVHVRLILARVLELAADAIE